MQRFQTFSTMTPTGWSKKSASDIFFQFLRFHLCFEAIKQVSYIRQTNWTENYSTFLLLYWVCRSEQMFQVSAFVIYYFSGSHSKVLHDWLQNGSFNLSDSCFDVGFLVHSVSWACSCISCLWYGPTWKKVGRQTDSAAPGKTLHKVSKPMYTRAF